MYSVELTWQSGNPTLPVCATDGCVTTYTLTQDGTVIATLPASATSYLQTPPAGTHTYTLTANALDINGNVVASSPVATTVVVP